MLGLPWKDTWFISPGNSYVSRLLEDAGGSYIWKDTDSEVSMPYGIENVFLKAMDADYWLNIGTVQSREEIISVDKRLLELAPVKHGNLYNNNNRISAGGGNDYWESGTLCPYIILNDIAAILHPELFPDYKLYFYKKIK
jgi:iron complex transport system substrate-binding protein